MAPTRTSGSRTSRLVRELHLEADVVHDAWAAVTVAAVDQPGRVVIGGSPEA